MVISSEVGVAFVTTATPLVAIDPFIMLVSS